MMLMMVVTFQPCKVEDSSSMKCRMPALNLDAEIVEQLNRSEFGLINSTGRGVAAYNTTDGRQRVDIYIGLKLDGFTRYRDISQHRPNIGMQFALDPTVYCQSDNVDFNPKEDIVIVIKVGEIALQFKTNYMSIQSVTQSVTKLAYTLIMRTERCIVFFSIFVY